MGERRCPIHMRCCQSPETARIPCLKIAQNCMPTALPLPQPSPRALPAAGILILQGGSGLAQYPTSTPLVPKSPTTLLGTHCMCITLTTNDPLASQLCSLRAHTDHAERTHESPLVIGRRYNSSHTSRGAYSTSSFGIRLHDSDKSRYWTLSQRINARWHYYEKGTVTGKH